MDEFEIYFFRYEVLKALLQIKERICFLKDCNGYD